MTLSRRSELRRRLDAHFTAVRSSAIGDVWKRGSGNWQLYAAVTGSAMAMATNAAAGNIVYATGPVTASVASVTGSGNLVSNWKTIGLKNATGAPIGKFFRIGVEQFNGDSLGGSANLAGNSGGVHFLHVVWDHLFTGGNFQTAFPVAKLASGAAISSKAGKFGGSFGPAASGFVASQRPFGATHSLGWPKSNVGFAGFSFTTGKGNTDYGWVRLEYTEGANEVANSITASLWAYSTGPLTPGPAPSGVPEPSSMAMALLAAGAAGVMALRRSQRRQDECAEGMSHE